METEQIMSDTSVSSHLSTALYRQKRNLALTDLVRPTPLTVSPSTAPKAADGCPATYFRTARTEQIKTDSSARLHLSTANYRHKIKNLTLSDLVLLTTPKFDGRPLK